MPHSKKKKLWAAIHLSAGAFQVFACVITSYSSLFPYKHVCGLAE